MEDTSSVRTIIRKLDRLKIPHPPISERGSTWHVYIKRILLIHESPLTDALFLLVSKSDEVTTT